MAGHGVAVGNGRGGPPRDGRDAPPHGGLTREEAQALAGLTALLLITAAWWALALWPVDGTPEWLARTRAVCFGVAADGLPDLGGWIGLIGGPLGMLVILLAGWSRGARGLLRRARGSRAMAAALGGLVLGAILLLTGAGWRVQDALASGGEPTGVLGADAALFDDVVPETYPRIDRPAPPLALAAHTGRVVDLASLRGRPVLVTFAYAHCATICPLLVRNALHVREALAGTAAEPAVLVVTLDPWRDTPSRLASMARDWGLPARDVWILGGSVDEVEAALDAWEVPRTRDPDTGTIAHPALTWIIDRDGRLAHATTGATNTLVQLLERL